MSSNKEDYMIDVEDIQNNINIETTSNSVEVSSTNNSVQVANSENKIEVEQVKNEIHVEIMQPIAQAGGHKIQDEGIDVPDMPILNFIGPGVSAYNSGGKTYIVISGGIISESDPVFSNRYNGARNIGFIDGATTWDEDGMQTMNGMARVRKDIPHTGFVEKYTIRGDLMIGGRLSQIRSSPEYELLESVGSGFTRGRVLHKEIPATHTSEHLHTNFEIPHDIDITDTDGELRCHIHFTPLTPEAGGAIACRIIYEIANPQNDCRIEMDTTYDYSRNEGSLFVVSCEIGHGGQVGSHFVTPYTGDTDVIRFREFAYMPSSIIKVRVERDIRSEFDTYNGDVSLDNISFHYLSNKLGTKSERGYEEIIKKEGINPVDQKA